MFPAVLLLAGAITALALMSGGGGASAEVEGWDEEDQEPAGTADEVIRAIRAEFVSQSSPDHRVRLEKLLREKLSGTVDETTSWMALPCDLEGAPSFHRVSQISTSIGEAYRVPIEVNRTAVGKYPFAVISAGPHPVTPDLSSSIEREEFGRHSSARGRREEFGGIFDLVFRSVVASAVGTVTSMGVQDLVRSMGGERRLARIMRHYRKAEAAGNEDAMARIREKVTRSASRIKGRRVNWAEVEKLTRTT